MDYPKIYNELITRAKSRMIDGYIEVHHIIPKCMNGTDDKSNLVRLTPEEHYVAHQLLVKIYPDHHGLVRAVQMMTVTSKNHIRNNKEFGWIRRKISKIQSEFMKGKEPWNKGKTDVYSIESLQKMSLVQLGIPESKEANLKRSIALKGTRLGIENPFYGNTHTIEVRQKISNRMKGINNPNYGKTHSDEIRQKISIGVKNSPKTTCPHCNKITSPANGKRWHFDNCKFKEKEI